MVSSDEEDAPSRKRIKIDVSENKIFKYSNGFHLNYIKEIENSKQSNAITFNNIITKVKPKKTIFFTFIAEDSFVEECFSEYSEGMDDVSIILGRQRNTPKLDSQKDDDSKFKRYYVPMEKFTCHHCKLTILIDKDNKPYVVIGTGNLTEDEWSNFTQCLYYAEPNLKVISNNNDKNSDFFKKDLIKFLEVGYGNVLDDNNESLYDNIIKPIIGCLSKWSFVHIKDRLVFSVPGERTRKDINDFSYYKVKTLLDKNGSFNDIDSIIVQCSSIGSIGKNPTTWLEKQYLRSLTNGQISDISKLKIIYPSVQNVRNCNKGYKSGYMFPYTSSTHCKQSYLDNHFYTWKSDELSRTPFLPHIKTITTFDKYMNPIYQIIGSQNLSMAAWGVDYGYGYKGKSYELGVITFEKDSMIFSYDLPLQKYGKNESVWDRNGEYMELDRHGKKYHKDTKYK
uniref:Tyrosyl-DNA phosphodiesterase n=1 Tax=Parastrongyloides trichosuri TaxID=131310 RepID=A0A0N4ZMF3_PARTI